MAVSIAAFPQFLDSNGKPLSGGLVWSYAAGTTTPLTTYTSREGDIANSNPVVLDADGRASIWLSANVAYKLVLESAPIFPATHGIIQDTVDDYYAGADPIQLQVAGVVPATGGTYTGLVNFTAGATFNGTSAQNLATLNSLGISARQNLWINSDGAIAQRTLGAVADAIYGFDRVINLAQTGSVTLSQLAQPENGVPYAMRQLQPDATAKRIGMAQIVEARNCLAYRGQELVFTARVRCSVGATIRAALVSWSGTAELPTRDVVNDWNSATFTAGNFFVASTDTIAVIATPVVANTFTDITVSSTSPGGVVAPATMNNLYMVVWSDTALAQNATLDVSLLRCGLGNAIQRWTPPDAEVETARCKRYYQNLQAGFQGQVASGTGYGGAVNFPVEMRTTPSLSFLSDVQIANFQTGTLALTNARPYACDAAKIATGTGAGTFCTLFTAYAELGV